MKFLNTKCCLLLLSNNLFKLGFWGSCNVKIISQLVFLSFLKVCISFSCALISYYIITSMSLVSGTHTFVCIPETNSRKDMYYGYAANFIVFMSSAQ